MMDLLRKYRYQIFLFTVVVFLMGTFIGFGGYFFTSKGSGDTVAEVNGEKIPLRLFYSHYRQALDQVKPGETLNEEARKQRRDEILRELIQSVVFVKEAARYGVVVPDQQVVASLAQIPAFQDKGAFSPRLYGEILGSRLRLSPPDFEEEQRRAIAFFKLRWLIQSCIRVTDKEIELAGPAKDKAALRDRLWQEKVEWLFRQWFNQISQRTHVKTYLDLIEGIK